MLVKVFFEMNHLVKFLYFIFKCDQDTSCPWSFEMILNTFVHHILKCKHTQKQQIKKKLEWNLKFLVQRTTQIVLFIKRSTILHRRRKQEEEKTHANDLFLQLIISPFIFSICLLSSVLSLSLARRTRKVDKIKNGKKRIANEKRLHMSDEEHENFPVQFQWLLIIW